MADDPTWSGMYTTLREPTPAQRDDARQRLANETHEEPTREVLTRFDFAPWTQEERTVLMAKEIVILTQRCDTLRAQLAEASAWFVATVEQAEYMLRRDEQANVWLRLRLEELQRVLRGTSCVGIPARNETTSTDSRTEIPSEEPHHPPPRGSRRV